MDQEYVAHLTIANKLATLDVMSEFVLCLFIAYWSILFFTILGALSYWLGQG